MQIKPCNLYQTAQEQIKRAEEVKKVKEVKKEDPEDWQSVSVGNHWCGGRGGCVAKVIIIITILSDFSIIYVLV